MAKQRRKARPKAAQSGAGGGKWPAYRVERWPLSRLKPYAANARKHSPEQIKQLRKAIGEFGWTIPILARPDGTIIAGHGRLEAGRLQGFKEVPVIVARGWSDQQCRAYALADNKLALNSSWDSEILGEELAELRDLGADLDLIGFSEKELARYLPPEDPAGGEQINLDPKYEVLIECADEAAQLALLERLQKDGLKCRALIA
jgi:ParB-like chromosome segregation protein Spo0J